MTPCHSRAVAAAGCVRGHLCRPQLARCRLTLMIPTGCWDRLPRNSFPLARKQRAQTHQASVGVGKVKATCGCASTYVSVQNCPNESPITTWFLQACDRFLSGKSSFSAFIRCLARLCTVTQRGGRREGGGSKSQL